MGVFQATLSTMGKRIYKKLSERKKPDMNFMSMLYI